MIDFVECVELGRNKHNCVETSRWYPPRITFWDFGTVDYISNFRLRVIYGYYLRFGFLGKQVQLALRKEKMAAPDCLRQRGQGVRGDICHEALTLGMSCVLRQMFVSR